VPKLWTLKQMILFHCVTFMWGNYKLYIIVLPIYINIKHNTNKNITNKLQGESMKKIIITNQY